MGGISHGAIGAHPERHCITFNAGFYMFLNYILGYNYRFCIKMFLEYRCIIFKWSNRSVCKETKAQNNIAFLCSSGKCEILSDILHKTGTEGHATPL